MTDGDSNPLDYPERPEITRERARRIAAIASECGEIIARRPFTQPEVPPPPDAPATPPGSTVDEVLVRDDLDAALRFFAAARAESSAPDDQEPRPPGTGATTLDFSRHRARRIRRRLLALLDELVAAVERRDLQAVWDVLDESEACRCFPPAVREEALVIARLPQTSFRAPIRLYRYYHMLRQLGDDPLETTDDPQQLQIALGTAGDDPSPGRTLSFPDRRDPSGGGPHNGTDRRRSGAR